MFCRHCGTKNLEGDAFCSSCGAALGAPAAPVLSPPAGGPVCPHCGTPAVPGQRFCRRCGAALSVSGLTPAPGGAAPSAPAGPVGVAPRARHKRGCFGNCLLGCVILALALLAAGVGGYVAFRNGALTMATVLDLVGMGPGDIEIDNFRDDAMQVSILKIESKETKPPHTSLQLEPFNISTYRAQNPGRYRLDFSTRTGRALGTCGLTVRSRDHYQFVALPREILINRVNRPVSVGTDLVVATSRLCR